MGVKGLLQQLAPIMETHETASESLEPFRGSTLAIDLSAWLYRGAYSCALELALGLPCRGHINFVLSRLDLLQHYGVKALVVADGNRTTLKADTNAAREEKRRAAVTRGKAVYEAAQRLRGEARNRKLAEAADAFRGGIKLSQGVVSEVLNEIHRAGYEVIVAPFEADPQLVQLCLEGRAQGIITEDSDVIVYLAAARCSLPVLTKFDRAGSCKVTKLDLLRPDLIQERLSEAESKTEYLSVLLRVAGKQSVFFSRGRSG